MSSVSTSITVDPNSVSSSLKAQWCQSQTNACTILCSGSTSSNTCDPSQLVYSCKCSNGSTPELGNYADTLPSLECEDAYTQCIENNINNEAGQSACQTQIQVQCGTSSLPSSGSTSSPAPVSTSATSQQTSTTSTTSSSTFATKTTSTSATPTVNSTVGNSDSSTTLPVQSSTNSPASTSTTATSTSASTSGPASGYYDSSHGLSMGARAGIAIGCVLLGLIILSFIHLWLRRKKKEKRQNEVTHPAMEEVDGYPVARQSRNPVEADSSGPNDRSVAAIKPVSDTRGYNSQYELPTDPISEQWPVEADNTAQFENWSERISRPEELTSNQQAQNMSASVGPSPAPNDIAKDEAELAILREKIERVRAEKERLVKLQELEAMEEELKAQIMEKQRKTMGI